MKYGVDMSRELIVNMKICLRPKVPLFILKGSPGAGMPLIYSMVQYWIFSLAKR
jgi:hypothetical protein